MFAKAWSRSLAAGIFLLPNLVLLLGAVPGAVEVRGQTAVQPSAPPNGTELSELTRALIAATTPAVRDALLKDVTEAAAGKLAQELLAEARLLFSRGSYRASFSTFEAAEHLAAKYDDKAVAVLALRGLGNVHYQLGQPVQAQDFYQRSLKLAEAARDQPGIQNAVINLGNVQYSQGDYGKALEHYRQARVLAEQRQDAGGLAMVLNNLGAIYLLQGSYPLALEAQQSTLKLAREVGDVERQAQSLNNLGLTRLALSEYAPALEAFQQALKLAEEKGLKPTVLLALNNLALAHEAQGQYGQAEACYRQGLKLAEALGSKEALAFLWSNLGNARRLQGDYQQTVELTGRAIQLAQQIGNLEILSKANTRAGQALAALGQPERAQQAFAAAIQAVEQLRNQADGDEAVRQRFLETRIAPYYGMIDLLVARGRTEEALEYAQRAKGRVLLDVLQSGKVGITKAMTPQEAGQERRLTRDLGAVNAMLYRERLKPQPDETRIGELDTQLQKLRLEQESFQAGLYSAHPELKLQRGELKPLSLRELGSLLPDAQTAILEYIVAEEQTYLFVITRSEKASQPAGGQAPVSLHVYPLRLARKEINDLTERFRRRIANRYFDFQALAGELHSRLLEPACTQLMNKKALIVVPDGGLWQLPFQALQSSNGRYLIEDYSIAYAPSLPVLQAMVRHKDMRHEAKLQPSLLAFGNPMLGGPEVARAEALLMGDKLAPLPETERQVNALQKVYGARQSKILLGTDAREDALKAEASRYRILHLATHGILNDANPLYSQLLLSQTPAVDPEAVNETGVAQEDGLLEAWEIMRMDLQAELVVLSACETARGRIGSGEGIIGLTWAFFIAGSPANVVSQWKVESRSTSELMLAFHRQLQLKPQLKPATAVAAHHTAEALRQASLQLLREPRYKHPFYWAGFVLIGDSR